MGRPGGFSAQREGSQRELLAKSVFAAIRDFGRAPSAQECVRAVLQPMPKSWARALRIWCRAAAPKYGASSQRAVDPARWRVLACAIPSHGFQQINASTGLRRARRPAALRRAAKGLARPRKLVPLCGSSCGASAVERVAGSLAHKNPTRASLIPSPSRRGRCLRACAVPRLSLRERRFRRRRGRR